MGNVHMEAPEPMTVGRKIASLIDRKKIEQRQLARDAGVDVGTINKLVNGKTPYPSYWVLRRLLIALGAAFSDLDTCVAPERKQGVHKPRKKRKKKTK